MKIGRRIKAEAQTPGTPYKGDDGLWRLDNVPICSTGIEYQLSTGKHTFTESELEDAVKAASGEDVAINAPRIKLGHKSKANELFLTGDEPAFGRVEGMTLSDNKQTVLGSFVGTPEWLAKVLPVAYPSRSVDAQLGVSTVTGKKYDMVITDVSLLGVAWPGCSVLEDLPLWYGTEIPEGVDIAASVDVSSIRSKFYSEGPGAINQKGWIRGERFDTVSGYTLIVDEGDGNLSRIPVEVDGADVKFGDPVPVVEQYADKAVAAEAVLAGMKMADPEMVIHASKQETTTREGETMDEELRQSLAKRLGLSDDATEEQIKTELAKPVEPAGGGGDGDGASGGGGGDGSGDGSGEVTPTGTPSGEPAVVGATVTLDRATYDHLKRGADLAIQISADSTIRSIGETVEAAVADGRIPPARREHWTNALKADFEGNKAVLDGLERGLIPITARGSGGPGGDGDGIEAGQGQGFPDDWFPEIKAIRAQAEAGNRIIQAKEG
jgi:hypothetical protein